MQGSRKPRAVDGAEAPKSDWRSEPITKPPQAGVRRDDRAEPDDYESASARVDVVSVDTSSREQTSTAAVTLRRELNRLSHQAAAVEKSLEEQRRERSEAMDRLERATEHALQLQSRLLGLEAEAESLKRMHESAVADVQKVRGERDDLLRAVEAAKSATADAARNKEELENVTAKVDVAERRARTLETELAAARKKHSHEALRVNHKETELGTLRTKLERAEEDARAARESATAALSEASASSDALAALRAETAATAEALATARAESTAANEELAKVRDEAKARVEELTTTRADLAKAKSDAEREREVARERIGFLESALEQTSSEASRTSNELAAARKERDTQSEHAVRFESELAAARKENERLQRQLDEVQRGKAQAESRASAAERAHDAFEGTLNRLRDDVFSAFSRAGIPPRSISVDLLRESRKSASTADASTTASAAGEAARTAVDGPSDGIPTVEVDVGMRAGEARGEAGAESASAQSASAESPAAEAVGPEVASAESTIDAIANAAPRADAPGVTEGGANTWDEPNATSEPASSGAKGAPADAVSAAETDAAKPADAVNEAVAAQQGADAGVDETNAAEVTASAASSTSDDAGNRVGTEVFEEAVVHALAKTASNPPASMSALAPSPASSVPAANATKAASSIPPSASKPETTSAGSNTPAQPSSAPSMLPPLAALDDDWSDLARTLSDPPPAPSTNASRFSTKPSSKPAALPAPKNKTTKNKPDAGAAEVSWTIAEELSDDDLSLDGDETLSFRPNTLEAKSSLEARLADAAELDAPESAPESERATMTSVHPSAMPAPRRASIPPIVGTSVPPPAGLVLDPEVLAGLGTPPLGGFGRSSNESEPPPTRRASSVAPAVAESARQALFARLRDPLLADDAATALRDHPEWLRSVPPASLVSALATVDYDAEGPIFTLARVWDRDPLSHSLIAALKGEQDVKLREHFAWLLKHLAAPASWKAIADLSRSEDELLQVRRWLLEAIDRLAAARAVGWREVGDMVTAILKHPDPLLRDGVVGILMSLERSDEKKRVLLDILRKDDNEGVLASAVHALGSVLPVELDPIIVERLLGHPSPRVQRSVMEFVERAKREAKQR